MSKEKIDWTANLQMSNTLEQGETLTSRMDDFVERATTELEALHIGEDIVAKVEAAGCIIKGPRYFAKLYSSDETVTSLERTKSAFVGSVAHGREDLASEAYSLLTLSTADHEDLNDDLVNRLNRAMKSERYSGGWGRHENLEAAAKVLGKPLYHRFLGGLATGLAMHARY
jgi:hypothetical protein